MNLREYLNEIIAAFRKTDSKRLRKIDDAILREASIINSKKLFHLAIVAYVLSKIFSKPRFIQSIYKPKRDSIEKKLLALQDCIGPECPDEDFLNRYAAFEDSVGRLESQDSRFIISLISKAKLKVAATLYAQGISLGVASEITGVEKQEILSYAGHTMMFDRMKEEKNARDRLKKLKDFVEG
ncbi:hypothetical protein KJ780_03655 [Candidatus Micrarchaeota archaeon]|nr:hypothetical protein [Candidatus Micrarchaeota archaeon]